MISMMYPNRYDPNNGVFIHSQARYLQKSGCSVTVAAPVPYAPRPLWFRPKWKNYGRVPSFELVDGIPVHYPRYINLPGQWFHLPSCYSIYSNILGRLDYVISDFRPDIIHAHMATPEGYLGLRISKRHRLPLVCSLRGSDINLYPNFDRITYALTKKVLLNADGLTSVSGALRQEAQRLAKPTVPIEVIYNGCEERFFNSRTGASGIRSSLEIPHNCKVFLFVGLIAKAKGVYELVNSFNDIRKRDRSVHLVMLGDGPDYAAISKFARSGHLNGAISLPGSVPSRQMPEWYGAADFFVLPTYHEGLPNAVLEAMASGVPVISTRVGGIPEVITTGETGLLVAPKNTSELTGAMDFVLKNGATAKRMATLAQKAIKEKFTWETNAQKMISMYESVLQRES